MEYKTPQETADSKVDVPPVPHTFHDHAHGRQFSLTGANLGLVQADVNQLQRGLNGLHTSMIAIGGAIGAGLFVSAGGAFEAGGPASVLIGFMIIGVMML
jgi:yeast amino acid transporter